MAADPGGSLEFGNLGYGILRQCTLLTYLTIENQQSSALQSKLALLIHPNKNNLKSATTN